MIALLHVLFIGFSCLSTNYPPWPRSYFLMDACKFSFWRIGVESPRTEKERKMPASGFESGSRRGSDREPDSQPVAATPKDGRVGSKHTFMR
jgi:hypothetical protein